MRVTVSQTMFSELLTMVQWMQKQTQDQVHSKDKTLNPSP